MTLGKSRGMNPTDSGAVAQALGLRDWDVSIYECSICPLCHGPSWPGPVVDVIIHKSDLGKNLHNSDNLQQRVVAEAWCICHAPNAHGCGHGRIQSKKVPQQKQQPCNATRIWHMRVLPQRQHVQGGCCIVVGGGWTHKSQVIVRHNHMCCKGISPARRLPMLAVTVPMAPGRVRVPSDGQQTHVSHSRQIISSHSVNKSIQ